MPAATTATTVFGFLDTNVFLHFPPIDQIDWPNLLGAGKTILVVTSVVIRELNRHKDAPISAKLRDRAASVLRRLHEYSEQQGVIAVRNDVELLFNTQEPLLDFASEGLARELPDDYLVGTVLGFRRKSPQLDVVLITDDLGLNLKARAYGVPTFGPPEHMRLPDEVDPSQKRIRELEERVRQLQLQVPDLKLVFRLGEDRLHFTLKPEVILSSKVLRWRLSRLQRRFPKVPKPPVTVLSAADSEPGAALTTGFEDYNEQLELFFSSYKEYLLRLQDHLNRNRRMVKMDVWAWNTGSCPARDTDIFLNFPDDIAVFTKPPERPDMPNPPGTRRPNTFNQTYVLNTAGVTSFQPFTFQNVGAAASRAVVDGNQVRMHIAEAKHHLMTSVDTIYAMFKSHAQAHSFTVDYAMVCANIPDKRHGQLHVIVERRG
jgi:PIN domain